MHNSVSALKATELYTVSELLPSKAVNKNKVFFGSPVVRTLCFHCREQWSEMKILHAARHGKKQTTPTPQKSTNSMVLTLVFSISHNVCRKF